MEISRTTAGMLAVVCLAAGAAGTFLALRDDAGSPGVSEIQAVPETTPGASAEPVSVVAEPAAAGGLEAPTATPPQRKPAQPRQARSHQPREAAPPLLQDPPRANAPVGTGEQAAVAPPESPVVADNDAPRSAEPPDTIYEELVVSADSVIGLQLESPVSSERAQVEDNVVARVTRDVRVSDRIAIPSGTRAFGEVTLVERGGKLRERARLGVRFTSLLLADGTRLPIRTETIYREGEAPARENATKIGGGAIGGAIIGGILGGAKGAAIGGSIGAGAGTAAVVAADRHHATLSAGSPLTVRLEDALVVTVER